MARSSLCTLNLRSRDLFSYFNPSLKDIFNYLDSLVSVNVAVFLQGCSTLPLIDPRF